MPLEALGLVHEDAASKLHYRLVGVSEAAQAWARGNGRGIFGGAGEPVAGDVLGRI